MGALLEGPRGRLACYAPRVRELRDIVAAFEALAARGETGVLATVVDVEGSTYRRAGARALLRYRLARSDAGSHATCRHTERGAARSAGRPAGPDDAQRLAVERRGRAGARATVAASTDGAVRIRG